VDLLIIGGYFGDSRHPNLMSHFLLALKVTENANGGTMMGSCKEIPSNKTLKLINLRSEKSREIHIVV